MNSKHMLADSNDWCCTPPAALNAMHAATAARLALQYSRTNNREQRHLYRKLSTVLRRQNIKSNLKNKLLMI
jgi:hypothetical protein